MQPDTPSSRQAASPRVAAAWGARVMSARPGQVLAQGFSSSGSWSAEELPEQADPDPADVSIDESAFGCSARIPVGARVPT